MEKRVIRAEVLDDISTKHYSTEIVVTTPGNRKFFIEVCMPVGRL